MRERVARLEQVITDAVKLASSALQQVINNLQALRGIADISAVTIASELGQVSRFEGARQKRRIDERWYPSRTQSRHQPGQAPGEPSLGLCDRLDWTRDNSQRQLPTDRDDALPTREYQTDQSSLKTAPTAARSVFGKGKKQRQRQKQPHRFRRVGAVTPYRANALFEFG